VDPINIASRLHGDPPRDPHVSDATLPEVDDDDEALIERAERALTEIKVAQGLSDEHASVLAALRIRLKGEADPTLEQLLESAGDLGGPAGSKRSLDDVVARGERKKSLDDVLAQPEKPKRDWPG
jgi:hypothetical protein